MELRCFSRWHSGTRPPHGHGAIVTDKGGKRVQAVDPFGAKRTRVMYAAQAGKVARLQWLIARGARLELKDWEGRTALWWAIREGRVEAVRELLARGAAVNTADNDGATPLLIAIGKGHLEVVRELLARGAAVDTAGARTPLLKATPPSSSCSAPRWKLVYLYLYLRSFFRPPLPPTTPPPLLPRAPRPRRLTASSCPAPPQTPPPPPPPSPHPLYCNRTPASRRARTHESSESASTRS